MIEELRNFILKEYAIKNKPIDNAFYEGIIRIVSKYQKLEPYIQDIEYCEIENGVCARYNGNAYILKISKKEINETTAHIVEKLGEKLNIAEKNTFKYFNAARIITHELTHVLQNKNIITETTEQIKNQKEATIARLDPFQTENVYYSYNRHGEEGYERKLEQYNDFIQSRYGCDIIPERDAEIQSYSILKTLFNGYENIFPGISKYMLANFYSSLMMGYSIVDKKITSPAYEIMNYLRSQDMVYPKGIEWFDSSIYTSTKKSNSIMPRLNDRIKMGLPINPEEYFKLYDKLSEYEDEGYIVCGYNFKEDPDDQEL